MGTPPSKNKTEKANLQNEKTTNSRGQRATKQNKKKRPLID
jgi:hypothetical protein